MIDLNEKIEARNQEELEITHDSDTRYLCDKEGVSILSVYWRKESYESGKG